jgi:hypothetical protein
MADAKTLMRLHVQALFTQDAEGRLLAANEPNGGPAPRFFLGRTGHGSLCWFRSDVAGTVAADLRTLATADSVGLDVEAAPARDEPFVARLSLESAVSKMWTGPVFVIPADLPDSSAAVRVTVRNADLLSPYLEAWRPDVIASIPLVAVVVGQHAVSLCASVRMTPMAHEAGVETHTDFRGRGYGAQAVASWAVLVRESGCLPLYSTSWSNAASRGLARRLGFPQFGSDLHLT